MISTKDYDNVSSWCMMVHSKALEMMDEGGQDGLPLGAQHNQSSSSNVPEEDEHFHQVCKSYQQYATFHQTKQQGVNRRMCQMLNSARNDNGASSVIIPCDSHPTIESILPPSLHPQTTDNQQYQKQFCNATIRNQFFLDNVLKYSGVPTSQDVLRQRREQQQEQFNNHPTSIMMEWTTEDQISKIDSVLKSVARDWSEEGKQERSIVYDRIIDALEKYLPLDNKNNDNNNNNGEASGDTHNHNCCNNDDCISNMNDDASGIDDTNEEEDQLPPPRVAVPGSGLGRLSWEIHSRGYSVEGSDFSLPMLLASDFMLNGCGHAGGDYEHDATTGTDTYKQFGICPWICETKNVVSFDKQRIRTVIVPDVDPTRLQFNENNEEEEDGGGKEAPEFTMMAGEFLHLYSHFLPENQQTCNDHSSHQHPNSAKQKFQAIACSFFLDTAPSLPHYLLTIYHMLEEGGLLINFGPLMYHWSGQGALLPVDADTPTNSNGNSSTYKKRTKHLDERYLSSIDYTWEEVRYMIVQCGFDIVEEDMYIPARYTSDERSMMKVVYDCAFLVARKKNMPK